MDTEPIVKVEKFENEDIDVEHGAAGCLESLESRMIIDRQDIQQEHLQKDEMVYISSTQQDQRDARIVTEVVYIKQEPLGEAVSVADGKAVKVEPNNSVKTDVLMAEECAKKESEAAQNIEDDESEVATFTDTCTLVISPVDDQPLAPPVDMSLLTPLPPKRRRRFVPPPPNINEEELPSAWEQPSTSAQFCAGGRQNTPRSALRKQKFKAVINYGSEEDNSENEDTTQCPVYLPRAQRAFYEELDEDVVSAEALGPEPSLPLDQPPEARAPSPALDTDGNDSSPIGPPGLFHFEWRPFPDPPLPARARKEVFTGVTGPTTVFATPYDAFAAIWDRKFMDYIASETNRYAQELTETMRRENRLRSNSRITRWQDTNADELYVYFALLLTMGVCVKSDLKEYWSKERFMATPFISRYITFNRFTLLNRCLHFNDNRIDPQTMTRPQAKLAKIAPVIEHLNQKFQTLYYPSCNIAIDESLTQWKGRLNIKQYIHNKAASIGIKTYEVCEAQTGYLWRFKVHAGREPDRTDCEKTPVSGPIASLVLELLKGLEYKGHTVWMDNYYNSPALARVLKSLGFDCVGTLKTDRQCVPPTIANLKKSDMKVGQLSGCTSGDVDLLVWRDTNRVAMISTYHGPGVHTSLVNDRAKPIVIHDYNLCMGGVDKKDQMLSMYPVERKQTAVWYKKLFRRLLNVSVLNAYIIKKQGAVPGTRRMLHREFRKTLITQILSKHHVPTLPPPKESSRFLEFKVLEHFPGLLSIVDGTPTKRVRRYCVVCHKRTTTCCPKCNVALCIMDCLKKYHSRV